MNTKFIKNAIFLIVLAMLLFLGCSKKKSMVVSPLPYVVITAEKTTFEGEGLIFYAQFGQPVRQSDFQWYSIGIPTSRHAEAARDSFITTDTVSISWNNIEQIFYSANNHDQVYIRFGNNDIESNRIDVSLVNHAPTLDSVKMNGLFLGKNADGDTINVLRMHMNPSAKETLQVFMHDVDKHDSLSFTIEKFDLSVNPKRGLAYIKEWVFSAGSQDTTYFGALRLSDNHGGSVVYPLEIVIYNEIGAVWVASTYGNRPMLNKLTSSGKKVFSIPDLKQVKFINVLLADRNTGNEATWFVNKAKTQQSGVIYDSVFVADDDGKVFTRVGGFKGAITGMALNHSKNIAYVIDTTGIKKVSSLASTPAVSFVSTPGRVEAMDVHQQNEDEYWAAVYYPATGKRYVYHVRQGLIVDTLHKGFRIYDSLDIVKSISVSTRNNVYWIGCDSIVILANMAEDTVISRISGFQSAYVVADQKTGARVAWVADAGNSKVVRIDARPSTNLPAAVNYNNSTACFVALTSSDVRQPRSLALDYNAVPQVLWVADYGNNRVLAVDGTTGAALNLQTDVYDVELENPEALSVNTGIF